jgi:ubiquinone/menaquinone biosynthesis C-methylase UbiE
MHLWWWFIRFGFRLLYNELAFTYDLISYVVSLGSWRCWQRAALPYLAEPGGRILEIAHGTGNLHLDLTAAGWHATGCDLSPNMGRITRRKFNKRGIVPNLARCRAQQLPFADGAFDGVVCTFPTDFIYQPDTLAEVNRVLKRAGPLVIIPTAAIVGGGMVGRFMEWLYRITGQRGDPRTDFRALLLPMFERAGFDLTVEEVACPRSRVTVLIARTISPVVEANRAGNG